MKNWKYAVRLVGISIVGLLLVKKTIQLKYSSFMFDLISYDGFIIVGLILLIWSLLTDIKDFRVNNKLISLIPVCLGIIFTTLILFLNIQINSNFNKPTLMRIYYDGDYNGTGIDFKTNGKYIFSNSAIGLSDYIYGEYEINGDIIILDKGSLDNVIVTNQLEIRPKVFESSNHHTEANNYVYQINEKGNIIENTLEFRLVVDNRK